MKKKLLIAFFIIFAIVVVMVILCFTLFAVSPIVLDKRSNTDEYFPSQEQILQCASSAKGKPVFFVKKNDIKKKIESSYPYVEVINIETVFPNKLVVHVKERQEVYAFKFGEKTFLADNNLVVLRQVEDYEMLQDTPIFIKGIEPQTESITIGEKIYSSVYVDLFDALLSCNRPLHKQMSMIKQIEFAQHEDVITKKVAPCAYIQTFDGHEYKIFNTNRNLTQKVQKFLTVYSSLYELVGKEITVDENSPYIDKKWVGVKWTKEMLDKAYIVIDDLLSPNKNNQCYANAVPNEIIE